MKKTLMVAISLIASVIVNAQSIVLTTSAGIATVKNNKMSSIITPVSMVGFEWKDNFGLEYGYSWTLNNSSSQLINYINGISSSYIAGQFTHLFAFYYKTDRKDNTAMNIGFGISSTNIYKAESGVSIEKQILPYFKVGVDQKFSESWSGTLNFGLGDFMMATIGITKKL